jgi:hypothetical protein
VYLKIEKAILEFRNAQTVVKTNVQIHSSSSSDSESEDMLFECVRTGGQGWCLMASGIATFLRKKIGDDREREKLCNCFTCVEQQCV